MGRTDHQRSSESQVLTSEEVNQPVKVFRIELIFACFCSRCLFCSGGGVVFLGCLFSGKVFFSFALECLLYKVWVI